MMLMLVRILAVVAMIVLHYVGFFLPLTELFLVYILFVNPRWFRRFLNDMAHS
ncbi:MAG: hypothetical protein MUF52_09560 [Syntrophobacteraceae bacterium]|jgi:hypothetical protein|nr:hypothetical protein [Syntrophobacteraceae bacterium]